MHPLAFTRRHAPAMWILFIAAAAFVADLVGGRI